ncbi:MAG: OmpH family outer membrane protein [Armatimonadota bacterium]|nr:OmpH family outer membrane protein [Armatimonadota bacterium]
MMHKTIGWLIGLCLVGSAYTQSFGIVDLERVRNESRFFKTRAEQLQALETRYVNAFQTLAENLVLNDAERQELTNLLLAEKPNGNQQQRIQQLTQTARQRAEELQRLRQKPDLTETEKAALEQFTRMETRSREVLELTRQQFRQQIEQRARQLDDEFSKALDEVIAQIARERKLGVVFFKGAFVAYAEVDITSEVIKRLDARK